MKAKHNIKPIYNNESQILILGTMPSVISREVGFYYAHPQNRFWKIFEVIFNTNLSSIEKKIEFLEHNHIAIWDTIESCYIKGSSDSSIKNIKVNDINRIIKNAPIKCVFCTGQKSYNLFKKYFKVNIPVIALPSPSSANATYSLEKLVQEYKIILNYLDSSK